jgi:phosphoenolpyruvate carboxylase
MASLAARLARPDPDDSPVPFAAYRDAVERPRFAAVFTAHPTFSLPRGTAAALARAACGESLPDDLPHRPATPTLEEEFDQAAEAIARGRDALDALARAMLDAARGIWGDRWQALNPCPVLLASWVGYDTDGRTDIGWWDTLRLRLTMKRLQLQRLAAQLAPLGDCAAPVAARVAAAEAAVAGAARAGAPRRRPAGGPGLRRRPGGAARGGADRHRAAAGDVPGRPRRRAGRRDAPRAGRRAGRAGGARLALAHTHVRLNASQLHNAIRQRLGIVDSPDDMARRRGLLGAINAALAEVVPQPVDFGALLAEQASAARLMLTVAQIVKHVDGSQPVRFLIAETETGYTLLSALWLARRLGVERFVEISPLFETAEALERGERVLEEALRSPHWRDYIRLHGRMCLQFGYSDSGRYVGQLAGVLHGGTAQAAVVEQLKRHGLSGIELVLFDTHGESIGAARTPKACATASPISRRRGTRRAARRRPQAARGDQPSRAATATCCSARRSLAARDGRAHRRAQLLRDRARLPTRSTPRPISAPTSSPRSATRSRFWCEDPRLRRAARRLRAGAAGPHRGQRPAARQSDGVGGPARITHPSQLRAIPNNAILHQLGWLANTLHGLGAAAAANPDAFADLARAARASPGPLAMAARAATASDLGVLRAAVDTLDPGPWLDRAAATSRPAGGRS